MKTKNKEEANRMVEEIKKLQLSATVELARKLQPAKILFGIKEVSEEDLKEAVNRITGNPPTYVSLNTNNKAAIIRFEKSDYYKFTSMSPSRLTCEYLSCKYEKHVSIRTCKTCKVYGHSADRCKTFNNLIKVTEKAIEQKKCVSCAHGQYEEITRLHPNIENGI